MRRHLITCRAAAEYLGLKFQTLEQYRHYGTPLIPFYKIGGCVRYAIEDLDVYLNPDVPVAKQKPLAPEWLTTEQARIYLGGIRHDTLRTWRRKKINLAYYFKNDSRIRIQYLNTDLEEFLDSHRYTKTVLPVKV